jgi:hypothetical protein
VRDESAVVASCDPATRAARLAATLAAYAAVPIVFTVREVLDCTPAAGALPTTAALPTEIRRTAPPGSPTRGGRAAAPRGVVVPSGVATVLQASRARRATAAASRT